MEWEDKFCQLWIWCIGFGLGPAIRNNAFSHIVARYLYSLFFFLFSHRNLCVWDWRINVLLRMASFMHEECLVLLWTGTRTVLIIAPIFFPHYSFMPHITGDVLTYCNSHRFCISLQAIQISTGQAYCVCTQLMFCQPLRLFFKSSCSSVTSVSLHCILWWWPQC